MAKAKRRTLEETWRHLEALFVNTDLTHSRMCWNDFVGCDFGGADLTGCDLWASRYRGCRFAGAVLRGADLRRATFADCDFTGADLEGAVAEGEYAVGSVQEFLTRAQQAVMTWTPNAGPKPPGG
jgi:uncharacterized protein YjbI with pentapeptide repeats